MLTGLVWCLIAYVTNHVGPGFFAQRPVPTLQEVMAAKKSADLQFARSQQQMRDLVQQSKDIDMEIERLKAGRVSPGNPPPIPSIPK